MMPTQQSIENEEDFVILCPECGHDEFERLSISVVRLMKDDTMRYVKSLPSETRCHKCKKVMA